jgi:hypothetical protein
VSPQTVYQARLIANYELDLFGRVASSVNAARADEQGAEDLYRSVQLALQADAAQAYFALRTLDSDRDLLNATIKLREDALTLLRKRYEAGETTDLDPARAEAELGTARADLAGIERRRANQEHALAVLTGCRRRSSRWRRDRSTRRRCGSAGCRRNCSNVAPISPRPSARWRPPTRGSAWQRRRSSHASR